MLYLLFVLLCFFVQYGSAFGNFNKCQLFDNFEDVISECIDLEPVVNIDVLSVSRPLPPPVSSTRTLCVNEPLVAVLRFTPREGQTLGSSRILWGDSPFEQPLTYVPCAALPPPLNGLPHPNGSQCAVATHVYNTSLPGVSPGAYPAAIFSENAFGKQVQVEGFIDIKRCGPSGDVGLLNIRDTAGADAVLCLQNNVTATVVAFPASGAVVLPATYSTYQGQPGNALIWWGGLPIADFVTEFPADGTPHQVSPPSGKFNNVGNVPTALILRTNEEQIQIEGFVNIENCV